MIAVVLAAGVAAAVGHEPDRPAGLRRDTTPEGRDELRALRREPILRFRAPGTRLTSTREDAAGRDSWNADMPTGISEVFALEGQPGEAVDAYRARAEEVGWRVVETTCSFATRSTRVLLTRQVEGRGASLALYGHLERPAPDGRRRGLIVSLTGAPPQRRAPDVVPARRRDVHCLRSFDPADPALAPPARVPTSSAEVCGLLRVAEAAGVVPGIRTATPMAGSTGCNYDRTELDGFAVFAAPDPKAVFEDFRSVLDRGDPRYVLLDQGTNPGTGVWVDTRLGPARVYTQGSSPPIDARQLVSLAELLARRT